MKVSASILILASSCDAALRTPLLGRGIFDGLFGLGKKRAVSGSLYALELIDSISNEKIVNIVNGTVIEVSAIKGMTTPSFNIRAATNGTDIQSVMFSFGDVRNYRMESTQPFAFCGNKDKDYFKCSDLGYGTYTISATPFTSKEITGQALTVTFTIVSSGNGNGSPVVSPSAKVPTIGGSTPTTSGTVPTAGSPPVRTVPRTKAPKTTKAPKATKAPVRPPVTGAPSTESPATASPTSADTVATATALPTSADMTFPTPTVTAPMTVSPIVQVPVANPIRVTPTVGNPMAPTPTTAPKAAIPTPVTPSATAPAAAQPVVTPTVSNPVTKKPVPAPRVRPSVAPKATGIAPSAASPVVTTPVKTPVVTSKAPVVANKAPRASTKAPVIATKAPVKLPVIATKAPVTATKAPVQLPVIVTKAPVKLPVIVTKAPVIATKAPVVATKAPVKLPVIITKAPVIATKSPVIATKAPMVATKAPVKLPVIVTKAPVIATKAPVITTKAPVIATKVPTMAPRVATMAPALGFKTVSKLELISTSSVLSIPVMDIPLGTVTVINLGSLKLPKTAKFNINAVQGDKSVKSVSFTNVGKQETSLPWAYCGNDGPIYNECKDLKLGATINVTIIPYPEKNQLGTPFPTVWAVLQFVEGTTAPTISPKPTPAPVPTAPTTGIIPPQKCSVPKFVGKWEGRTAHLPVAEAQGAMIGTDFVIVGGFLAGFTNVSTQTQVYDTTNPKSVWTRVDDYPFELGITHGAFVVVGKKFYMCGGYAGGGIGMHTDVCMVYDHSKPAGQGKQWSLFTPLPDTGRAGGAMIYDTTLDALVFSGGAIRPVEQERSAIDYSTTWMYSLSNPSAGWVEKAPMPFLANHMSFVTAYDNLGRERHYFTGGQLEEDEHDGNVDDHYEYDVINNKWYARKFMTIPRSHAASSTIPFGCGFIMVAGCTNAGEKIKDISYYDTVANTWTKIGDLSSAINTPVCGIKNGFLYCDTGWDTGKFSKKIAIVL